MLTNFTSLKFVLVVLIISISVPGHNIAQEHDIPLLFVKDKKGKKVPVCLEGEESHDK